MKHILRLAWRHLAHYRVRSLILASCIALTFALPVAVHLLVTTYARTLMARADATPLVAGAKGSRYDLVLNALYFRGRVPAPTSMAEVDRILDSRLATPVPVLARRRARGHPVVGTTHDYFHLRNLALARGTPPLVLGDAVLGAKAARALGLERGDTLASDPANLYDLTLAHPLRLKVVGVLAETGTPDDAAVLVDLKTAWIMEGIGHGHGDARDQGEARVLEKSGREVVLNAGVVQYTEITPRNMDTFHFHGEASDFPLTAVLVIPHGPKGATLLKGRYRVSPDAQLLVPADVVAEILGFVFQVKRFFDANAVLVTIATALFLALVVLLSLRVRHREMETLFKIGCARRTVLKLLATELLLTTGAGLVAAIALAGVLVACVGF